MAMDTLVVFAAQYDNEADAVADFHDVEAFYRDSGLVDTYDAAVFTHEPNGKVKVVKKREEPTRHGALAGLGIGLVGGVLVALFPAVALGGALLLGGAGGAAVGALAGHVSRGMRRSDLKELGELLDEGESGLLVVAGTDVEARVEEALRRSAKLTKKELKADEKMLDKEVKEAAAQGGL